MKTSRIASLVAMVFISGSTWGVRLNAALPTPDDVFNRSDAPVVVRPVSEAADGVVRFDESYFSPPTYDSVVPPGETAACEPLTCEPVPCFAEEAPERLGLLDFIPHQVGPLTAEAIYTGEVFTNSRGGINTTGATRYRGNLDLTVTGDLDALAGLKGMSFFLYGGQIHGESLSMRHLGDWQLASNIDPFPYTDRTQLHEYWIQQELWDGKLTVKGGRVDANADFGFADLGGDFINSSFATMPTIPLNVWPAQSLGGAGFLQLQDGLTLGVGVYESNKFGIYWGDADPTARGMLVLGHLEWKTQIGPEGQLPGTWRAGAWIDSGRWNEISDDEVPRTFGQNHGIWFTGDQMLLKEEYGTEDEQGLGAFFEYGWAPQDRNFVEHYYGGGLVYRGLLNGRDADTLGVGVANVVFGRQTRVRDELFDETAIELFYKAQVTDFIVVQPDFQFITNPGGAGRDSIFTGVRFELVL